MSGPGDRQGLPALGYAGLLFGGWAAANALIAIGVLFTLFLMFANGSAAGFFAEAANLARRYEAATPARRESFLHLVESTALIVFVLVCALRARTLSGPLAPLWRRRGPSAHA